MIWRLLFYATCVEILLDGFFIYFLYPSKIVHLIKDAFFLLTLLFFVMKEPVKDWIASIGESFGNGLATTLSALLIVGVVQVFNPLSPGLLRGVLGIKIMFMPMMGILLGFAFINSTEELLRFLRFLAIVSVPVNTLGMIQYINGPNFMIQHFGPGFAFNSMLAFVDNVKAGDSFMRIFSTFSSSAAYALFLSMNTMVCMGLISADRLRRFLWLAILGLNFFAVLGTGSRGGFMMILGMIVIFLYLTRKNAGVMIFSVLVPLLCLSMGFAVMKKSVSQRFQSGAKIENIRERTIDTAPRQFLQELNKHPLGKGIGAASQASRHLGRTEGKFNLVENYVSKIQMELGIVGVIVFYIFILLILFRWYRHWLPPPQHSQTTLYLLAACLSAYGFGQFTIGTLFSSIDTPPASFFLWIFMGIMMRIPYMLETEKEETASQL